MNIDYLKINGFGKIKDKEIELKEGINVIYGENETGKSSILKFISSMLYGASKNKNGKDISDFEKFKPWKTEDFSGKIKYRLDSNESYEIYREFKKKNPVIYNENMEDISKEYTIDKTKGSNFFYDQTGIDEETFYNTAITEQEGIKLSKSSQNSIVQKISNLISSGDDNISYKKSMEKITKMQNEEVGTDRTAQRPINVLDTKIRNLLEKKRSLAMYKENIYDNTNDKIKLESEIKQEESKNNLLKEIKNKLDNNRIKSAEINFNKNLENEYNRKIEELNEELRKRKAKTEIKKDKIPVNLKNYYILLIAFMALCIIMFAVCDNNFINSLSLIPIFAIIGIILKKNYEAKRDNKKVEEKDNMEDLLKEIEILKQNMETQKKEASVKEEKLDKDIEKEQEELTKKYIQTLDLNYIETTLNKSYDEILREIDVRDNRIQTSKFKLHTMELDSKNISAKIEDLAKIEEELIDAEAEKEELMSLNRSFNIAKECLSIAYDEVKENISPKFIENLCDIISKISDDRYKNIRFSDTYGLKVEVENGKYEPASRLSVGTIDQMYLSLRLSALTEISNETMPIILDEAFAYFDNERLKNMLMYLYKNYSKNQIIIFTCSNREKEILDSLKIQYNSIKLEK